MIVIIVFLFFSVFNNTVSSQIEKDAGLWATFTLQKKITKKISIAVDQETRLRENFQRINLFYTNIGVDYKLNKHIKISPSYRFIQKVKIDMRVSYRHRLSSDLTYKKKFNKSYNKLPPWQKNSILSNSGIASINLSSFCPKIGC